MPVLTGAREIRVTWLHLNWLKAPKPNRSLYFSRPAEQWTNGSLERKRFDVAPVMSLNCL